MYTSSLIHFYTGRGKKFHVKLGPQVSNPIILCLLSNSPAPPSELRLSVERACRFGRLSHGRFCQNWRRMFERLEEIQGSALEEEAQQMEENMGRVDPCYFYLHEVTSHSLIVIVGLHDFTTSGPSTDM